MAERSVGHTPFLWPSFFGGVGGARGHRTECVELPSDSTQALDVACGRVADALVSSAMEGTLWSSGRDVMPLMGASQLRYIEVVIAQTPVLGLVALQREPPIAPSASGVWLGPGIGPGDRTCAPRGGSCSATPCPWGDCVCVVCEPCFGPLEAQSGTRAATCTSLRIGNGPAAPACAQGNGDVVHTLAQNRNDGGDGQNDAASLCDMSSGAGAFLQREKIPSPAPPPAFRRRSFTL